MEEGGVAGGGGAVGTSQCPLSQSILLINAINKNAVIFQVAALVYQH